MHGQSSRSIASELAWALAKMVTVGDCQPRDRLRIVGIRSHSVPPPVKDDAIVAEAKENEHGSNCSPSVHGR